MIILNGLMLDQFVKGLHKSGSLKATVINSATSFLSTVGCTSVELASMSVLIRSWNPASYPTQDGLLFSNLSNQMRLLLRTLFLTLSRYWNIVHICKETWQLAFQHARRLRWQHCCLTRNWAQSGSSGPPWFWAECTCLRHKTKKKVTRSQLMLIKKEINEEYRL